MDFEGKVVLPGGRVLGYAEYGDPQGNPVFLFHGQPGNRLFHPGIGQIERSGVRLIVPDRPGYGLSEFQEGRKILDWPGDVLAIADHLSIEKFSVIGFSGGGPYALACGYKIPERLARVLVVSGAPKLDDVTLRRQLQPLVRVNYVLNKYAKPLLRLFFWGYWRRARKNPLNFLGLMRRQAPAVDRMVLEDRKYWDIVRKCWEENLRVDSRGYVYDAEVLMDDWGFSLGEVRTKVELWWGGQDENVPPGVMDYFSSRLPNCTKKFMPDGGHFLLLTHWEQIFLS